MFFNFDFMLRKYAFIVEQQSHYLMSCKRKRKRSNSFSLTDDSKSKSFFQWWKNECNQYGNFIFSKLNFDFNFNFLHNDCETLVASYLLWPIFMIEPEFCEPKPYQDLAADEINSPWTREYYTRK